MALSVAAVPVRFTRQQQQRGLPTNTNATRSSISLPSWATLIPPRSKSIGREPLHVPAGEETYLRTKCYHAVSRRLDAAVQASFDTLLCTPVYNEWTALLQQVRTAPTITTTADRSSSSPRTETATAAVARNGEGSNKRARRNSDRDPAELQGKDVAGSPEQ